MDARDTPQDGGALGEGDAPKAPSAKEIQTQVIWSVSKDRIEFLSAVVFERDKMRRKCPPDILAKFRALR
jgi:hypothetical protein